MLGKLLKYDLKALGKIILPMQLIAFAIALCSALAGWAGYWMYELDPAYYTSGLQAIAAMFVGGGFIALACLLPATFVVILHRFYTNFFTDQGYLTFTLPVNVVNLLWSKILSALIWLFVSVVVSSLGSIIVTMGADNAFIDFDFTNTMPYWILALSTLGAGESLGDNVTMLLGVFASTAMIVSFLLMAYLACTLGAVVAKRHKILCGIALFLSIWCVVSIISGVFSIVVAFGMFTNSTGVFYNSGQFFTFMYVMELMRDIALSIGYFCITLYCLKRRVNLS